MANHFNIQYSKSQYVGVMWTKLIVPFFGLFLSDFKYSNYTRGFYVSTYLVASETPSCNSPYPVPFEFSAITEELYGTKRQISLWMANLHVWVHFGQQTLASPPARTGMQQLTEHLSPSH